VTLRRVNHPADSMRLDPARQSSLLLSHISLHMDANPFVTFLLFFFFFFFFFFFSFFFL
jgi:hypothetical protein